MKSNRLSRAAIAISLVLAGGSVAGCSTVATRRADPPTFTGSTSKTLPQFQTCFANQFAKSGGLPSYLPRENGGTYTQSGGLAGEYVGWVLDIDEHGEKRVVVLHAVDSIWGKNKGLITKVGACL